MNWHDPLALTLTDKLDWVTATCYAVKRKSWKLSETRWWVALEIGEWNERNDLLCFFIIISSSGSSVIVQVDHIIHTGRDQCLEACIWDNTNLHDSIENDNEAAAY